MKRWRALVLLALVGCTGVESEEQSTTTTQRPVTTTMAPAPGSCGQPQDFAETGVVATITNPASDSATIGLIAWEVLAGCERFSITFQSNEGAPSTTPPSLRAEFLPGLPILRIFVDSGTSVLTDQLVETALVSRIYVVTRANGEMFVDLHLAGPTLARVTTEGSPAGVLVELRPGIVDPVSRPLVTDRLIVVSPQEGSRLPVPVVVAGYSRSFDEGVLVIATAGTEILYERMLEPVLRTTGWVEFQVSLVLARGPVLIFVGEDEPGPGGLVGLVIPVTVE